MSVAVPSPNAFAGPDPRGAMERIEAADFHDIVGVSEPRVAPGGEQVAFVRKVPDGDEEYEATVHLASTGGGEPRRFTLAEGVDSQPRFSPSGDRLAFVSTRGADDDRPQLWVVPTDGGEARQVTDVVGGVADPWVMPGEERTGSRMRRSSSGSRSNTRACG